MHTTNCADQVSNFPLHRKPEPRKRCSRIPNRLVPLNSPVRADGWAKTQRTSSVAGPPRNTLGEGSIHRTEEASAELVNFAFESRERSGGGRREQVGENCINYPSIGKMSTELIKGRSIAAVAAPAEAAALRAPLILPTARCRGDFF